MIGVEGAHTVTFVVISVAAFVIVCELLLPLVIVGRDPERVLELLLPSFGPIARALGPMTRLDRADRGDDRPARRRRRRRARKPPRRPTTRPRRTSTRRRRKGIIEGEERRLLQSIVDFGDTLVREVMTPRPDIVAIREDATVGDLRALFREQEYSRFPVYKDSLDNIAGFVFVKDLVALGAARRRAADHGRCCGRRSSCPRPSACRSCSSSSSASRRSARSSWTSTAARPGW